MESIILKKNFILLYDSKYVHLSQREEENIEALLKKYESYANVPLSEITSVCYANRIKNEFVDDENYFFIPVNKLRPHKENLADKRRKTFLNFIFNFGKRRN